VMRSGLEEFVERGVADWWKHPWMSLAVTFAHLIVGAALIILDISTSAGGAILVGGLVGAWVWVTRIRGKPRPASATLPRPRWEERPLQWWLAGACLGLVAIAGLLTFLAGGSTFGLVAFLYLAALVVFSLTRRAIDMIRPGLAGR
jgi:hypothetical protein